MAIRNKQRQSKVTQIPSIPELKSLDKADQRELQRFLMALKETTEIRDSANSRGVSLDKAVTWNDLVSIGFDIGAKGAEKSAYNLENIRNPIERWDDLRFPATAAGLGASAADLEEVTIDGANYLVLAFAAGVADEQAFFTAQIPHAWKYGSKIEPHMHWMVPNANAGNVKFVLDYIIADINGTFTTTVTDTKIFAAPGVAYKHVYNDFSDIEMSGKGLSTIILFRLTREQSDGASDTYASDAYLLEFDLHFQVDKFGSLQENTNKRG